MISVLYWGKCSSLSSLLTGPWRINTRGRFRKVLVRVHFVREWALTALVVWCQENISARHIIQVCEQLWDVLLQQTWVLHTDLLFLEILVMKLLDRISARVLKTFRSPKNPMDSRSPKLYLYLSNNNRFVWLWASVFSRRQFPEISFNDPSDRKYKVILINWRDSCFKTIKSCFGGVM